MADRDEEIVAGLRRIYEAFNRGDFDTAIAVAHPEIEFVPPARQFARQSDPLRGGFPRLTAVGAEGPKSAWLVRNRPV